MRPKSSFFHAMTCFFTTDENGNPPKKKPPSKSKSKRNGNILLSELIPSKPKRRPQINNSEPKISKEIVDLTMEEDDPMPIKIQILDETLNMDPILIHMETNSLENAFSFNTNQSIITSDKSPVKTEKILDNDIESISLKEENTEDSIPIDGMSVEKQTDPLINDVPFFRQSIDSNIGLSSGENNDTHTNNTEPEKVYVVENCDDDSVREKLVSDDNRISSIPREKNSQKPKGKKSDRFHSSKIAYVKETDSYYCFLCEASIKEKRMVSLHVQNNKYSKSGFACSICEQRFQWKGSLTRHLRQHFGTSNLEKNLKADHTTDDISIKFQSTTKDAHETFNNLEQLLQSNNTSTHLSLIKLIRDTDREDINIACGYCDQCFSSQISLVEHCRTHMADKPFICNICGTLFKQNAALVYHTRSHFHMIRNRHKKSSVPYIRYVLRLHSCDDCDRSYISWSALNQHIRTAHSDIAKRFVCRNCDKAYDSFTDLLEHKKKFCKNKKPKKINKRVTCEVCKKTYSKKQLLRNHVFKIHPGRWID